MSDITLNKLVKQKKISREIVKEILDFGVNEDQKIYIISNLSLTLENNELMKEIAKVLEKHTKKISKQKEENKEKTDNNILLP